MNVAVTAIGSSLWLQADCCREQRKPLPLFLFVRQILLVRCNVLWLDLAAQQLQELESIGMAEPGRRRDQVPIHAAPMPAGRQVLRHR